MTEISLSTLQESLQLTQTFLDQGRIDTRVGQAYIRLLFTRQGPPEMQARAEGDPGFMQHGLPERVVVLEALILHGPGYVRIEIESGVGLETAHAFDGVQQRHGRDRKSVV